MLRLKYVGGTFWPPDQRSFLLAMTGQAPVRTRRAERAKPGDRIIFAAGEHQGKPARIELLVPGNPPIAALPADPVTGAVRDGSRFNKLLLLRVNPDELDAETRSRAIDGVLAYSAICTHQGCTIERLEQGSAC